jgi:hypothetical protein
MRSGDNSRRWGVLGGLRAGDRKLANHPKIFLEAAPGPHLRALIARGLTGMPESPRAHHPVSRPDEACESKWKVCRFQRRIGPRAEYPAASRGESRSSGENRKQPPPPPMPPPASPITPLNEQNGSLTRSTVPPAEPRSSSFTDRPQARSRLYVPSVSR